MGLPTYNAYLIVFIPTGEASKFHIIPDQSLILALEKKQKAYHVHKSTLN